MQKNRSERNHSTSRTLAAVAGTLPLSLAIAVALALALPLPLVHRVIVGAYSTFPVWVASSAWIFLSPTGKGAWLRVAAVTAAAAAVALVAALLRGPPEVSP